MRFKEKEKAGSKAILSKDDASEPPEGVTCKFIFRPIRSTDSIKLSSVSALRNSIMKRPLITAVACLLLPSLAATGVGAAESTIHVTRTDCRNVVRHSPSADVEYQPGTDVYGRRVAPADLGGPQPIDIPDEISIAIGIDLAEKFGFGAGGRYESEGNVGTVTVKGGKTYWNGKLLGDAEQHAILEACRKIYGKRP